MMKAVLIVTALTFAGTGAGYAAEPIVGNWKTESGETASIGSCGGGYCITLKTGKFAGKRIGSMTGSGAKYEGSITDPANDKTYTGYGNVNGRSMKLKGCVLSVLCKTQTWSKL